MGLCGWKTDGIKIRDTNPRLLNSLPHIIVSLTMFFHQRGSLILVNQGGSLILVSHSAHILHLSRDFLTLLQPTLRIRCSSCWLKWILFVDNRANFSPSLRHFKFSLFPTDNVSLSSNIADLINNIAFLLNNNSFLMASSNVLQLLDFHHHPLDHIHHLLRTLFYFQSFVTLHCISTCIVTLIVDWGCLLFCIWICYV